MGKKNGELLRLAARAFDVLLTIGTSLSTQQAVAAASLAIVGVRAKSNRIQDLLPLVARIREAVARSRPGKVILVSD